MKSINKTSYFTCILFGFTFLVQGQQTEQFTHYMLNKYLINPAYAGFDRSLSVTASYRSQWEAIPNQPKQYEINAHLPFYLWNGALGFKANSETLGVEKNNSFQFSYNYIYQSVLGYFSTGLSLGLRSKTLDGLQIVTPDGQYDNTINHNDPLLNGASLASIVPTWTFGTYLVNDYFEAGVSVTDFVTANYSFDQLNYKASKHMNAFFQTFFFLGEEIELRPSIMLKTNFQSIQSDLGVIGLYKDLVGGLNFRGFNKNSKESFGIIIGTKVGRRYTISYSYDRILGNLNQVSQGTHEIYINYNLDKLIGLGLPPKIIYNPRNL